MSSTLRAGVVFTVFAFIWTSAVVSSAETINYTYDDMLRLIKAQYGDGTTVDYVYDNLGNRLTKTTTLPGAPANNPPNVVSNPTPANSSTDISTAPALSWTSGEDPDAGDVMTYSVYFGTSSAPPLVATGADTSYSPGQLQALTTYYWKVIARDNHNSIIEGPLWSFTSKNDSPVASFSADRSSGWAPLKVYFTDNSQSPDDEIVSWAWDFNGDGITDSTDQNPTYTYTSGGAYSVSLTVTDEHGATVTETKSGHITVYDDDHIDENIDIVMHCVTNSVDLQSALTEAQANGKNDLIQLVQGTYGISGNNGQGFSYGSNEPYKIFIKGGYTSGCVSRELNPENTIIDGENIFQSQSGSVGVLRISDYTDNSSLSPNVYIVIDGVAVQNSSTNTVVPFRVSSMYGNIIIKNNLIKNHTTTYASIMYSNTTYGNIVVSNNVVDQNRSTVYGDTISSQNSRGNIDLINNIIEDNYTNDGTGSVVKAYTDYGYVNLASNTIKGNSTKKYAGGRICSYNGKSILVNNKFIDNYSATSPGGIELKGYYGTIDLTNNTITGNRVYDGISGYAGGLYIYLYGEFVEMNLYNNIIRGNNAAVGGDIYIDNKNGKAINAFNNDFDPAKVYGIYGTFTSQGNNLNADPLFVNAAVGNYRLLPASPVMDAGNNAAPSLPQTDIAGYARIIGTAVDMGAYEYGTDFDEDGLTDDVDPDDDNDGMPDDWEISHGLNPFDPFDGDLDQDGDGLTNLQEYLAGTNPQSEDTDGDGLRDDVEIANGLDPLDPADAAQDADGDGMNNGWEIGYGFDPHNPADAAQDADGDGLTNLQEYLAGTDPTTPNGNPDPVMLGSTQGGYTTIQQAYDDIPTGQTDTIKVKAGEQAPADLFLDRNVSVRLEGGYDDNFTDVVSDSSYFGTLTITGDSATISDLIVK